MPKIISDETIERLCRRRDVQRAWLQDEAPYISEDQRHLDANTPERAYWRYGYFMALTDMLSLLDADPNQKADNADISNPIRLDGPGEDRYQRD